MNGLQTLLRSIINRSEDIDFVYVFFFFIASLHAAMIKVQTLRGLGQFTLCDPSVLPPHVGEWIGVVKYSNKLPEKLEDIVDKIRLYIEQGAPSSKRQKSGGGGGASSASSAASGNTGYPHGFVIRHCYDFQRPGGCSRQGCQKEHILIACTYQPSCSHSADKCRFHHD